MPTSTLDLVTAANKVRRQLSAVESALLQYYPANTAFDTDDLAGMVYNLVDYYEAKLSAARGALRPFADMDREGCDLREQACERGVGSDMTILTSQDFRKAKEALNLLERY